MPPRGRARGARSPPGSPGSGGGSPAARPGRAAERYEKEKASADDSGEKQLSNDLKLVTPLCDSSWPDFLLQINIAVHRNKWPESVLNEKDAAGNVLIIESMTTKDDIANYKLHVKISNAYTLLITKCQKHVISSSLASVKIGDARGAWKTVRNYFVRTTPEGIALATKEFHVSSQASTDTNLLEWFRKVDVLAENLATATGVPVSDVQKKTMLLGGLLPEFKTHKQRVQDKGNAFTLSETRDTLQDYAKEDGLLELKKGTSQRKSQTYPVFEGFKKRKAKGQSPTEVPAAKRTHREHLASQLCKRWVEGTCPHGTSCYRQHKGPGGCLKQAPAKVADAHTDLPIVVHED